MKRLIEATQDKAIVCDNPNCDYEIDNSSEIIYLDYIDKPCPKCGENLLTFEDYIQHEKLLRAIKWVNKWFSWLTIFSFKKDYTKHSIHVHDGVKIKKIK